MTHFDHNPLKAARHTRLIELQPRSAGDGLRCLLKTISIDEAPKYEALSYVWGLTTEGHSICVTQASSDRSGTLPITDNLYKALQWLRQEHEPRLLWIDAIVINQNDLEERMQQVSIMRDIYFRASHVVIWLGEASEDLGL
ncbi:HET-domain-containing protein, partial [Patellaria atrata CBS 101060]